MRKRSRSAVRRRVGRGAVATVTVLGCVGGPAGAGGAFAVEEHPVPTAGEVARSRAAVTDTAAQVAAVAARLDAANRRLRAAAVAAGRAAEAYDRARDELGLARREAVAAGVAARAARADEERQRAAYGAALAVSYQLAPELTALSAMADAEGIETVIERSNTLANAEDALSTRYDAYRDAALAAALAEDHAVRARARAQALADRARQARREAARASAAARAEVAETTAEKDALLRRMADLQDITVALAARRQSALELAALERAARRAAREQPAQEGPGQEGSGQEAAGAGSGAEGGQSDLPGSEAPAVAGSPDPPGPPTEPEEPPQPPEPEEPPQPPEPDTPQQPPPAGGAAAALAFARAQIGDPYAFGADGPHAWDCSGLTMGAWAAGGIALPHYSVAQYTQSTPVSASALRPADLVFWGSSSNPASIYHVALYVGDDRIVHAPRTGRAVTEESMYYWIPPNFHARP